MAGESIFLDKEMTWTGISIGRGKWRKEGTWRMQSWTSQQQRNQPPNKEEEEKILEKETPQRDQIEWVAWRYTGDRMDIRTRCALRSVGYDWECFSRHRSKLREKGTEPEPPKRKSVWSTCPWTGSMYAPLFCKITESNAAKPRARGIQ
jgi:hypothetical protein